MRLIKVIGLAAIAIAAATAIIGAGSASANVKRTVYCKVNQNLCTAANLWGSHVIIKALAKITVLLGTITLKCHSEIKFLSNGNHSDRLLELVISLLFSSCKGCTKATTTTLPSGSVFPGSGGNGILETTSSLAVLLEGCPLGIECTLSASKASMAFTGGTIGSTALFEANEVPVLMTGSLCGSEGKWDAGPGESEPFVITEVNGSTSGSIFVSKESHA